VRFDVPAGQVDDAWVERLKEGFHAAHEAEYGHRFDAEIEIVNVRVVGVGRIAELEWAEVEPADVDPQPVLEREVVFDVDGTPTALPTPFYERELLAPGNRIAGPAIVEQVDSTIVVYPGQEAVVDDYRNVIIHVAPAA
jgi:5-oxoprolinase (ATP-hydrolysing)